MKRKQKYGELIDVNDANQYLRRYDDVRKSLRIALSGSQSKTPGAQTSLKKAKSYAGARINAFIFRRDVIDQLLKMTDSKRQVPAFFMIHYAAKANSTPTLVILGCNKSGKKFKSMMHLTPCAETPGTTWIPSIEKNLSGGDILSFS